MIPALIVSACLAVPSWSWDYTAPGQWNLVLEVPEQETFTITYMTMLVTINNQHDINYINIVPVALPRWGDDLVDDNGIRTNVLSHWGGSGFSATFPAGRHVLLTIESSARALYGMSQGETDTGLFFGVNAPLNDGTILPVPWGCGTVYHGFYGHFLTSLVEPGYSIECDVDQDGDVDEWDRGIVLREIGAWCAADVDADGRVDQSDLAIVLAAYDTTYVDPWYSRWADITGDGRVDQEDLSIVLGEL